MSEEEQMESLKKVLRENAESLKQSPNSSVEIIIPIEVMREVMDYAKELGIDDKLHLVDLEGSEMPSHSDDSTVIQIDPDGDAQLTSVWSGAQIIDWVRPSVNDTVCAYKKHYGTTCTEDCANEFIENFIQYREIFDNVNPSSFSNEARTIDEYIKEVKASEEDDEQDDKFSDKLKDMSPKERFLYCEGFSDDFGFWLQSFIDATEEGKELLNTVVELPFQVNDKGLVIREILSVVAEANKDLNICNVDGFVDSVDSENSMAYLNGIMGDGDRALRTIHYCSRAFKKHCESR